MLPIKMYIHDTCYDMHATFLWNGDRVVTNTLVDISDGRVS